MENLAAAGVRRKRSVLLHQLAGHDARRRRTTDARRRDLHRGAVRLPAAGRRASALRPAYGWNPELGLDQALLLLRLPGSADNSSRRGLSARGTPAGVRSWTRPRRTRRLGRLVHQPGSDRFSGADHFVVVTAADRSEVTFHDPQGHPYVVLPTPAFLSAWRAEAIGYLQDEAYVMRTAIRRTHDVAVQDALCALVRSQPARATGRSELPVPPTATQDFLTDFSIRVGARRRGDAARSLRSAGYDAVASCLDTQAATLGALQYPAMTGDRRVLVRMPPAPGASPRAAGAAGGRDRVATARSGGSAAPRPESLTSGLRRCVSVPGPVRLRPCGRCAGRGRLGRVPARRRSRPPAPCTSPAPSSCRLGSPRSNGAERSSSTPLHNGAEIAGPCLRWQVLAGCTDGGSRLRHVSRGDGR
jgi:hypothetical protein